MRLQGMHTAARPKVFSSTMDQTGKLYGKYTTSLHSRIPLPTHPKGTVIKFQGSYEYLKTLQEAVKYRENFFSKLSARYHFRSMLGITLAKRFPGPYQRFMLKWVVPLPPAGEKSSWIDAVLRGHLLLPWIITNETFWAFMGDLDLVRQTEFLDPDEPEYDPKKTFDIWPHIRKKFGWKE